MLGIGATSEGLPEKGEENSERLSVISSINAPTLERIINV